MEVWRLSLTITRAISGYGLVAAGIGTFAVVAHDSPAHPPSNASFGKSRLVSSAASTGASEACDAADLNTCAPRSPMRALSAKEVAVIMGANSNTLTSHGTYQSHGGCDAGGCHTTATVPPASSNPPVTSGPPASSLGGGSGGANNVPDAQQQAHLIKCAEVYGHTSPNPKFGPTNFTNDYGWSFYANSNGLPVVHDTTTDSDPPTYTPSVSGGGEWLAVSASTFFQDAPYHTDLYVYAYSSDATTVGVLAHEWYHQNNDAAGESAAQRQTNEQNATAAGKAAEAAYNADNGAKCAN
jgi:hypothetical protein